MKRVLAVLALVVLAGSVTPALAQSNERTIDTAHSATIFTARHLLVSNVRGQLGPVKGTVKYDGKDIKSIEADVVIDVTQLNTRIEARDKHLRSADFFDAENHPTMTFNLIETGGAIVGDEIQVQIDLEVVQKLTPPAQ